MAAFYSKDHRWRVQVISRDGQQLYRISHKGMRLEDGRVILHGGPNRLGPLELPDGWWLAEDTPDPQRINHWVSLKELEEHE